MKLKILFAVFYAYFGSQVVDEVDSLSFFNSLSKDYLMMVFFLFGITISLLWESSNHKREYELTLKAVLLSILLTISIVLITAFAYYNQVLSPTKYYGLVLFVSVMGSSIGRKLLEKLPGIASDGLLNGLKLVIKKAFGNGNDNE